jgi:hypothetical protein
MNKNKPDGRQFNTISCQAPAVFAASNIKNMKGKNKSEVEKARDKYSAVIGRGKVLIKLPMDYDLVCDILEGEIAKTIYNGEKDPTDAITGEKDPTAQFAPRDVIVWTWVAAKYGWTWRSLLQMAHDFKKGYSDKWAVPPEGNSRLYDLIFDMIPQIRKGQQEYLRYHAKDWRRYKDDQFTIIDKREFDGNRAADDARGHLSKLLLQVAPVRTAGGTIPVSAEYPLIEREKQNIIEAEVVPAADANDVFGKGARVEEPIPDDDDDDDIDFQTTLDVKRKLIM